MASIFTYRSLCLWQWTWSSSWPPSLPYTGARLSLSSILASDWSMLVIRKVACYWSIFHRYSVSTSVARSARQGQMALMKKQDLMDEFVRCFSVTTIFLIWSSSSFSTSSCSWSWDCFGYLTVFTFYSMGTTQRWRTAWRNWSCCLEFSVVSTFQEASLYSWYLFVKGQHYPRLVGT